MSRSKVGATIKRQGSSNVAGGDGRGSSMEKTMPELVRRMNRASRVLRVRAWVWCGRTGICLLGMLTGQTSARHSYSVHTYNHILNGSYQGRGMVHLKLSVVHVNALCLPFVLPPCSPSLNYPFETCSPKIYTTFLERSSLAFSAVEGSSGLHFPLKLEMHLIHRPLNL